MEKMLVLKAISEKKSRQITRRDGSSKVMSWYQVILTNGLDTMYCETSESLTQLIDSADPSVKLDLQIGQPYSCRMSFSVGSYQKDGQTNYIQNIIIHQMAIL